MPAFATSTSTAPNEETAADIESGSPTSAASSPERDTRPTSHPRAAKASATAAPIPREAPVTSTRVPGPISTPGTLLAALRLPHVARPRHRRRGGVPPGHLLAPGGGPADHRRERRPCDAGVGPHCARDDRPPRERRLHHARSRQAASVHRLRPRARLSDRAPPPADRALPHRRLRHPLGPGPRGGGAARALDVAGGRGAHAARDQRFEDLPARPPDLRG